MLPGELVDTTGNPLPERFGKILGSVTRQRRLVDFSQRVERPIKLGGEPAQRPGIDAGCRGAAWR